MAPTSPILAADILEGLRRHHGVAGSALLAKPLVMLAEEWALLDEVRLTRHGQPSIRIDALAVRLWSSAPHRHERIAYEIKVSRSDLLHELASPEKRAPALAIAHRWVLATPPGLVRNGELPEGAGLVEFNGRGCHWLNRGTRSEPTMRDKTWDHEMTEMVLAVLARRACRAEARLKLAAT